MYNEFWGRVHFVLFFIGTNLIFLPHAFYGLAGMPRRIIDYPEVYGGWNYITSIGGIVTLISFAIFFIIVFHALVSGKKAPANYWGSGADTLEWTLDSPPDYHSFEEQPIMK